nr:reverse transcriptase domain-containing protein [Tanacetum cinerariifolium]
MVRALLLDKKNQSSAPAPSPTPAPVKAVEPNCVTCGGAHSYQDCPATNGNVYRDNIQEYVSQAAVANYNQGNTSFRPHMVANQIRPPGFPPVQTHQNNQNNFNRGNNFNQNRGGNFNQSNFNQGGNFNQGQLHRHQVNQPPAYQAPAYQAHIPQTQRTLPSNTITNPKEDLNGITTRSGVAYQGPTIPTPPKVVKQGTEVTKDQVQTPSSQSTAPVQPPVVQSETQTLVSEPVVAPKLSEMARTPINEHCSAVILNKLPRKLGDPGKFLIPCEFPRMNECLALADLGASINLMPLSVWERLSLSELTLTCMTLEFADRSVSKPIGIAKDVSVKVGVFHFPADFVVVDFKPDPPSPLDSREYDPEGDILLLEAILNSKPLPPLPNHEQYMPSFKKELKVCEAKTVKSSVDEPPEVELKDLPPHLEYAFLGGDNKLPVIIAKELGDEEKSALIKVL